MEERRITRIFANKKGTFADMTLSLAQKTHRIRVHLTAEEEATVQRLLPLTTDDRPTPRLSPEDTQELEHVKRMLLYRGALFVSREQRK